MMRDEIAAFLAGLRQFQWVDADPVAALMWHSALDRGMPLSWALEQVAGYYGRPGEARKPMVPGMLNGAWRERQRAGLGSDEAHCGRLGCACRHRECYRGWLDGVEPVVRCRVCHPGQVGAGAAGQISGRR